MKGRTTEWNNLVLDEFIYVSEYKINLDTSTLYASAQEITYTNKKFLRYESHLTKSLENISLKAIRIQEVRYSCTK